MIIVVTGASGLVGRALVAELERDGHAVRRLVRASPTPPSSFLWDPIRGTLDERALDGADAIVHLAGESVAGGRWTEERKARIRDSRVLGTRTLAGALARRTKIPATLISASAVGYYGDTGDGIVDESASHGHGFLADVCVAWEGELAAVEQLGVRVARMRFGIVLAKDGGALAKMTLPFKLGVGGTIGDGRQWMAWVAIEDVVGALAYVLEHDRVKGPLNVVAPEPVTNADFTRALGHAVHRPTVLPVPAFALSLVAGKEMASEMFLGSSRVLPKRLTELGYRFRSPDLAVTLSRCVGA